MAVRLIKFTDGDVKTESFLKDFMFGKIFAGLVLLQKISQISIMLKTYISQGEFYAKFI